MIKVEFTQNERIFYDALMNKSQTVFEGLISAGTASKSWFAIFSLLQRLRQACDHLALTVKGQIEIQDTIKKPNIDKAKEDLPKLVKFADNCIINVHSLKRDQKVQSFPQLKRSRC